MSQKRYLIESETPFAKSLIWKLNRDYYHEVGVDAWRTGKVPHQLTSNSMVGKTYAKLILGILKDLGQAGHTDEIVYLLELGAGHGRLAFHILKHLELLIEQTTVQLPPYCYVLSDIVEDDLSFFEEHPQFQTYFEQGVLDVTYFDGTESTLLDLRYAGMTINPKELQQPLVALANYFFDSLPIDLFRLKNRQLASCSISLSTTENPQDMDVGTLLEKIEISHHNRILEAPFYKEAILNEILTDYQDTLKDTHLLFPYMSFQCIEHLRQLSNNGLILISMDKGFHDLKDLENEKVPDMVPHGGISFWVNYHAFGAYCKKHGGKALFPAFSTFNLELGCMFLTPDDSIYKETNVAYQQCVNDFGPDDFNSLKESTYKQGMKMSLAEIIAMIRLSDYDSTFFINILPRFKQLTKAINAKERHRIAQTMNQVWDIYFTINEPFDLAYEIGGLFYDLGYYKEALRYFGFSTDLFGAKADVYYNQALCYYQLREDRLFIQTLKAGRMTFPNYPQFSHLDKLDLGV